MAVQVR